ncbi:unnamed protein product [Polarella glacialis]|uniref:Uncharacterized protein n=1 Tax=Polarella glacialis TaxID=89957 RepID=A0A813FYZ5_POLGL|nr:unnamed protein product [Polarella glacialis]
MARGGVDVPGPRGPDQFLNKQLQLQETLSRCPACGWIRQQQSMLGVPQSDSTAHETVWLPALFCFASFACSALLACSSAVVRWCFLRLCVLIIQLTVNGQGLVFF